LSTKIIDRDKACIFCGRTKNLQTHHLVPREYEGSHDEDNLGAACRHCHMVVDAMIKIMKTKNPDFDIRSWLASFMEGA
jgi:5-methylcytosine-specific restriction endonuclease McrA